MSNNDGKNTISKEQEAILVLLSRSVFGTNEAIPEIKDLGLLYEESKHQGVVGNVFSELDASGKFSENADFERFFRASTKISVNNYNILCVQDKAISILNENGIDYAVMKGSGIAKLYPDPSMRMTTDSDILVAQKDHEKVEKLLLGAGFTKSDTNGDVHSELSFDGKTIELHKTLNGLPEGEIKSKILAKFENIEEITEKSSLEGFSFKIPKPEYTAIILLLHAYEHLCTGGIGLRHVLDHAVFAKKYLSNESEERESILALIKELKMFDFASILTKCAEKVFSLGNVFDWCEDVDDAIIRELTFDIFDGGLYGKKKSNERYLSGLIVKDENDNSSAIVRFFRHYVKTCKAAMPAVVKFPPLYAISFIYVPVRFVFRVLTGKRRSVNLKKTYKSSVKRYDLYKKFNMFGR